MQLAESSSTLDSSSLGESDCDQEEVGDGKESHELMCSDEEDDEEEEEGEFLLKDEQVEDFASSVLAAISCWHYTVQAFLSSAGTVRLSAASLVFISSSSVTH